MSKKEIDLIGLENKPRELSNIKQSFLIPQINSLKKLQIDQENF